MNRFLSVLGLLGTLGLVLISLYAKSTFSKSDIHNPKVLRVYAYSSMASSWGSGPHLSNEFEKTCGCRVEWINVGDSNLILQRLKFEGPVTTADLVIGLDQFSISQATKIFNWSDLSNDVPSWDHRLEDILKNQTQFLPFDWSPMTFIYRKGELDPPTSVDDLRDKRFKESLVMMDPRTSVPGLLFSSWIHSLFFESSIKYFHESRDAFKTVLSSWSSAYGLFKKKQVPMAFSYLTSPVYHWMHEKEFQYQPAALKEPLPVHIEFLGIPVFCKNCEIARDFVRFILSDQGQRIVSEYNVMLPATDYLLRHPESLMNRLPPFKIQKISSHEEGIKSWKQVYIQ